MRQIALRNRAQRLGRRGVAGQNHQMAAFIEKTPHRLQGELIDKVERARAVWRTGIVAEIQKISLRQPVPEFAEDGQSAVTRVKNAYHKLRGCTV